MKIVLPVVFTRPVFRADKSVKLEFDTREFGGEEAMVLMEQRQKEGWLLFSPNSEMEVLDIPNEKADSMTGQKTQAQRIRAVLYRKWESLGKKGDFENFYKIATERIIEQIKASIEG